MEQKPQIEIVITSEYSMYAHAISSLLIQGNRYKVSILPKSDESYLRLVEVTPDILITTIQIDVASSYEWLKNIVKNSPMLKILAVTDKTNSTNIFHLSQFGVLGLISFDAEPDELFKAIEDVSNDIQHQSKASQ